MYERFDIQESNLSEGMKVNGTVKQIKPYGAFIELNNRSIRTFTYRGYVCIKNKNTL